MTEAKPGVGVPPSNTGGISSGINSAPQSVLNAVQLDQLLSLLSYSSKNKSRTDSLANIGLETLTLENLCQRFSSIFSQKVDSFKVSICLR